MSVDPKDWIPEATRINLDQLLNVNQKQLSGLGGQEFGIKVSDDEKSLILFNLAVQETAHPAIFVGFTTKHYGKTIPRGYIWMNGRKLLYADNELPQLQEFLDGMYGSDEFGYFIPDTRNYFERGFAGESAGVDFSTRSNRGDGASGGKVGTKQLSANLEHDHLGVPPRSSEPGFEAGPGSIQYGLGSISRTEKAGGSESRPINLNPWFIMWTGDPTFQDTSISS